MKAKLLKTKGYKISRKEIEALVKNSKERLRGAKSLIEVRDYRDSVSRAYYAILDSAKALLLHSGYFAKTHAGVLTLFSLKFIKEKQIPIEYKTIFKQAKEYREHADYSALIKFSKKQAQKTYEDAKKFVKMVAKRIKIKKGSIALKAMLL